jgi:ferritin-like metal-binding protein YciE
MAVNLLDQSLQEERTTDEKLTRIAEQSVNRKAAVAGTGSIRNGLP